MSMPTRSVWPQEQSPLCIRSSRREIQMTNHGFEIPKWKVILSFPRWMDDTMRVATLESPDLECPMTTPLFFTVGQSQPSVPHSLVRNNNPSKSCALQLLQHNEG